jgi:16S rRNA (cytosine1402-N4)-methyltransferase
LAKTNSMHQNKNTIHVPVLLEQTLAALRPQPGDSYLDLTAGYGGHAAEVLERTTNFTDSVLVDRDIQAINALHERFDGKGIAYVHDDFLSASKQLLEQGKHYDLILADLGVSSLHLNVLNRGFSVQGDGPLDMRMDERQALSAATIVNEYSEADLAELLKDYGEEPKAKQIARTIVENRPISSTKQLASIVARAWPGHSRVHPATRSFQAIRIAVNDELGLLEHSLPVWHQLLAPGGRLVTISFHSLEDRIVKQYFQTNAGDRYDADLRILTKRPQTASSQELVFNPRARSAKLRAAVKIKR